MWWIAAIQKAAQNTKQTSDNLAQNLKNKNNNSEPSGIDMGGLVNSGVTALSNNVNNQSNDQVQQDQLSSDRRIKEPTPQRDLLAEVAEEINNYTYHYKPGVGEDPGIEYSGPMAQELLQVDGYRSTVIENPETGLLEVDTDRLAMVNAGMIADLAKRLMLIESLIEQVMQGFQEMPEQQQITPDVE